MPYSMTNPPAWLGGLPEGAVRIGIEAFNAVYAETRDEEKARNAAWSAVKARYEKAEDGTWSAKEGDGASDRTEPIRFRASQDAPTGLKWEVIVIEPGLSLSSPRFMWTDEVLERAAADRVFDGVDVNAYELGPDFFTHLPIQDGHALQDVKRYLSGHKVGWIERTWFEPGVGVKGEIRFLPVHAWLPEAIAAGMSEGNDEVLGLSIDSRVRGFDVQADGVEMIWVTRIAGASSVDVVTRPAAGGRFLRALQAQNEERKMDKAKWIELIRSKRPELLNGKDAEALTDDQVFELARQAMEPEKKEEPDDKPAQQSQGMTPDQVEEMIRKKTDEVERRAACGRMLDATLAGSDLPDFVQKRIRTQFDGKTFDQKELDDALKGEREVLGQMAATMNSPRWGDQSRVTGGLGSRDKIEMAADMMLGLTVDNLKRLASHRRLDGQPRFEGMRAAQDYDAMVGIRAPMGLTELYVLLTGDRDVNGFGTFIPANIPADVRASQDITSATFTYVMGNTLNRRLVSQYMEMNFQENLLISIRKPVRDFRTQEATLVGYFGDIETIDPETSDYQVIAPVTDEEATYTVGQRGNICPITRKVIINDDISVVQRIVDNLARAARRTHAKFVWAFFKDNSNCSDGTAWFTSGHGNYTTSALSFSTAVAAYLALAKMTEKDSAERIGLLDWGAVPTLVYPIDLAETAEKIVNDDHYFSSNDLTAKTRNFLKGKIKGAMVSNLTDATNWGLIMPSNLIDIVEVGYLKGREEPEFFLADNPLAGHMFSSDKIEYKIRHEYGGTLIDYRSGYGGVVAG